MLLTKGAPTLVSETLIAGTEKKTTHRRDFACGAEWPKGTATLKIFRSSR